VAFVPVRPLRVAVTAELVTEVTVYLFPSTYTSTVELLPLKLEPAKVIT